MLDVILFRNMSDVSANIDTVIDTSEDTIVSKKDDSAETSVKHKSTKPITNSHQSVASKSKTRINKLELSWGSVQAETVRLQIQIKFG